VIFLIHFLIFISGKVCQASERGFYYCPQHRFCFDFDLVAIIFQRFCAMIMMEYHFTSLYVHHLTRYDCSNSCCRHHCIIHTKLFIYLLKNVWRPPNIEQQPVCLSAGILFVLHVLFLSLVFALFLSCLVRMDVLYNYIEIASCSGVLAGLYFVFDVCIYCITLF